MDWIMNLPPACLSGLLTKPRESLNDIENAVRDAIEALYSHDDIKAMIAAAGLDSSIEKKSSVAVARVRKI